MADFEEIDVPVDEDVPAAKPANGADGGRLAADPNSVIGKLQADLQAERNARLEAERRAHTAAGEVQDNQLALVSNALDAIKQNAEVLKANYAAALSAGDFSQAADIQEQIADNSSKKLQLEQGKAQLEAAAKAPRPAPQVAPILDPVENMARQLTPRSAAWVRAHPDYATNPKLTQRMLAAHNLAVTEDIPPDSDAYFAHVERTLGLSGGERPTRGEAPTSDAAQVTQRRDSSPPSAPTASVGSSSGGGSSTRSVRLTAEEREMARLMDMTDEQYAKNKVDLLKKGRLN